MVVAVATGTMNTAPKEDMHIHSTFSDGMHSIPQNVATAEAVGLKRMCCVDHVRRDTAWVPQFVEVVRDVDASSTLSVLSGVEAKILDEYGTLDIPDTMDGVDFIYAADHRFPLGGRCLDPKDVKVMIAQGVLNAESAVRSLFRATHQVIVRNERVVVAHFLSILPKVGLDESMVSLAHVEVLARCAKEQGASFEIDERWSCPSQRITEVLLRQGVPVFLSTDSHRRETIGVYEYAEKTWLDANEAV